MKKVRVFELAKEFGMRGPDLAKLLREIGFDNVKTHMTVLDDADLMMVEARLSAQGLKRQAVADGDSDGLPKKKSLAAAAEATETEAEPELPKKTLRKKPVLEAPKKTLPKPLSKRGGKRELPSEAPAEAPAEPAQPAEPVAETAAEAPAPQKAQAIPEAAPAAPAPEQPAEAAASAAAPSPAPASTAPKSAPPSEAPASPQAPAEPVSSAPAESAAPAAEAPAAEAAEAPAEAAAEAAAETGAEAAAEAGADAPAAAPEDNVRKLLVPAKRATVVGRIELPQETIRDARSRSAPASARDLRKAAFEKMQQRTGQRSGPQPGQRRGPAGPGMRGGRDSRDGRGGPGRRQRVAQTIDPNKVVEVEEPVSIKALSEALGTKVSELIATLTFKLGIAGKNINSFLTNEEVELIGLELERKISVVEHKEAMDELIEQLVEDSEGEESMTRAPVVTFMGHVDHGKTSLMDAMRKSGVAKGEAGGITQHIGAYKITNDDGQSIVVLDTPGHAAFTAMRARGADITDVVVLVVAGDDGVMPQTEEAINHAKAAKVPIIVAITKCDLPSSKPMQVKQQLMIKGLQAEEFGGDVGVVEVSAVTGVGLDELFERIMLDCEMLELQARPDAPARGVVVESRQSPEQGVVVTLLVTDGTLRLKDQIVCGESFARVRAMIDDKGNNLTEAGPSTPITVFGLDRLPTPGDKLFVVDDAKKAREVVEERQRRLRDLSRAERSAVTLETLSAKLAERNLQEIKLILKADAMGSLEPLRKCLDELATDEVRVNLVHSALGGINETDVSLASASGAIIVGFHTVADSSARQMAERADVEIRYYEVIYQLLDDVRAAMEGMLAPAEVQSVVGHAEIKAVFKSSKFGNICGLRITDGFVKRSSTARLSRDGVVLWSGKIGSLRRLEEDVREVKAGFECGMTLEGHQDVRVGDQLEFVQIDLVKRTLGGN
ncbi:MAG: translation initiation factor IF-2 [Planctomycetes bacterium]|nr:translation initiation factor IF-2 [Planctomycetota bacterium]